MRCLLSMIAFVNYFTDANGGAESSFDSARPALGPASFYSRRVGTTSSRTRAGGWAARPIVTNEMLLEKWASRRQFGIGGTLTAPLLLEGAIYFFEDNVPAWNVSTDPKAARERAKLRVDYQHDNSTCISVSDGHQNGTICAREAALRCSRNLTGVGETGTQADSGYNSVIVHFYCGHNETCAGWDCGKYNEEIDSGVTIAIVFFCFLVFLSLVFLVKECLYAFKVDKQYRQNIGNHEPLYLTARKPALLELSTLEFEKKRGGNRLREVIDNNAEMQHAMALLLNLPSIDEADDDCGDD